MDGDDDGALSLINATKRLFGIDLDRHVMRNSAREEAEKWGWAGATKQLRNYYKKILDHTDDNNDLNSFKR